MKTTNYSKNLSEHIDNDFDGEEMTEQEQAEHDEAVRVFLLKDMEDEKRRLAEIETGNFDFTDELPF